MKAWADGFKDVISCVNYSSSLEVCSQEAKCEDIDDITS